MCFALSEAAPLPRADTDGARRQGIMMKAVDFALAPFLLIWETTQACDLTCRHCRASAQPLRHPDELTTAEGERLLEQTATMGTPVFILSGGDPVKRPDLYTLIRKGKELGLRMGTIPAATAMLTQDLVSRLKDSGLDQMAVSLDFPREDLHDSFRGVPGAFSRTMQAIEWAHKYALPLQINTTLCGRSAPYLAEMADLVERLGIVFWEVFFLVPVGRGEDLGGLTAEQCEELFAILYRVQKSSSFVVKITEGPHYRRYVAEREAGNAQHGAMHVRKDRGIRWGWPHAGSTPATASPSYRTRVRSFRAASYPSAPAMSGHRMWPTFTATRSSFGFCATRMRCLAAADGASTAESAGGPDRAPTR
jgi:MoaA/NifB/PqqE/SkfB family radical SAM enzyme